jgi:hypothetical protein
MRKPHHSLALRCAALALAAVIGGCATDSAPVDNLPRRAVSGTVRLGGKPLARGTIQLLPPDHSPATALQVPVTAEIQDGSFQIPRAEGPVPGKYRVTISSRPLVVVQPNEEPGLTTRLEPEQVPETYNRKTTLEAEVKDGDDTTLTFDLKG